MTPSFSEFVDPNPNPGNDFGHTVVPLSTGNVVITSPLDDAGGMDAGAVYLFNGSTGALISTLTGSSDNNMVGSDVIALPNGNFVVTSPGWDNGDAQNAGAVTFGNGITGVSGVVSAENSLVGTTEGDEVGGTRTGARVSITVLTNGNYVVASPLWNDGSLDDVGAVTLGSGVSGVSGPVSSNNSLVGTSAHDGVGGGGVTALANGNYVVVSTSWRNASLNAVNAGAVTFGDGISGISGPVSSSNSLVGTKALDLVGKGGVTGLTNGNYVVASPEWINGSILRAGAVTFGDGTSGVSGTIDSNNSLLGTSTDDLVGQFGVTALTNGNYVIASPIWNHRTGAVTFGNGTSGVSGTITSSNSLVGTSGGDQVGFRVTALANGNYVVVSRSWDNTALNAIDAGAVTLGSGTTGVSGPVGSNNSLVGTSTDDGVGSGGVTALTNGNYVVESPNWNNGSVTHAGAVTLGNGTNGISGPVNSDNSLVGTADGDRVGSGGVIAGRGVTALANGNYVVASPEWNNGSILRAGAVTFGDGTSVVSGPVSISNSLVGTTADDFVGFGGVAALTNGNYVVISQFWDNAGAMDAGAVTFGNGTSGISGPIDSNNSLVGTSGGDRIGDTGQGGRVNVTALSNGNYVVGSPLWDSDGIVDAGAVTFGSGTSGVSGIISSSNSLVGTLPFDLVGQTDTTALSNGNYVVAAPYWDNPGMFNVGAVTLGSGTNGIHGAISRTNSLVGTTENTNLQSVVVDYVNDAFYARFLNEAVGGRVRVWPASPVAYLSITADAVGQDEGTSGMTAFTFTVTRSFQTAGEITVDFEILAGGGLDANDFGGTLPTGKVTFADGDTEETITIQVSGDTAVEMDELLTVMLSNPSADAVITVASAASKITNDEQYLLSAAGPGGGPHVIVRHATSGEPLFDFFAYDARFTGGVRVATGDINGDGAEDIITAAGINGGPHVKVFDGLTGQEMNCPLGSFFAYDTRFTGGVFIATGDVDGDGFDDVITGAGSGGGPHVRAFSGVDGSLLADFFAYDAGFLGGVRVAVGDINNDGVPDIVTGAGAGGGPHVRAFSGDNLSEIASFFAYDANFTGGVYVATGQLNPLVDQNADIITGAGAGGGPHVRAFSGADSSELLSFFAYDSVFLGGVNVATIDLNNDGISDIITGAGAGGGPHVRGFDGSNPNDVLANLFPFDTNFTGGLFVASTPVEYLPATVTAITLSLSAFSETVSESDTDPFLYTQSPLFAKETGPSLSILDNEFADEDFLGSLLFAT